MTNEQWNAHVDAHVNRPRPKIEGKVDTPRTLAHRFLQEAVAEEAQATGAYSRVGMGRPLSEFSGLQHSPDIKADVICLTREGRIDLFEIRSPGQSRVALERKLQEALNQLPPEMRGGFAVIDPADALK